MTRKNYLLLVIFLIFSLLVLPLGSQAEAEGEKPGFPVTVRMELRNIFEGEKGQLEENIYNQIFSQLNEQLGSRYSDGVKERITDVVMQKLLPELETVTWFPDFEKPPSCEDGPAGDPAGEKPGEGDKPDDPEGKERLPVQEDPPADGKEPSFTPGDDEAAMLELINRERKNAGLQPLKLHEELSEVARIKAGDMVENNYFSHYSPQYGSPFDMMSDAGISYLYAGENLAMAPSVESAHQNLMNSPGHRANILNQRYTHAGVGAVESSRGKIFVQMFMRPR